MKLLNRASVLAVLAISLVTAPIAVGAAETAKATLKDAKGQDAGSVSFIQTPAGVLLQLSLKDVPTGEHPFISMQWASASRPASIRQAGTSIRPTRTTV
jgi:Cu/Zn superoxide dismutase